MTRSGRADPTPTPTPTPTPAGAASLSQASAATPGTVEALALGVMLLGRGLPLVRRAMKRRS